MFHTLLENQTFFMIIQAVIGYIWLGMETTKTGRYALRFSPSLSWYFTLSVLSYSLYGLFHLINEKRLNILLLRLRDLNSWTNHRNEDLIWQYQHWGDHIPSALRAMYVNYHCLSLSKCMSF